MEKKKTEEKKETEKEKKVEEVEEKRKFWHRKAFRTWIGMAAVIALIIPIAAWKFLGEILWLPLIVEVLTFFVLGLWLKRCLRQVGAEVPSQAVLTRFAEPIDAVSMGLHFVFWPFEDLIEFPTGEYSLRFRISTGLYSKEENNVSSQPMEVEVNVYLRFPRIELKYSFPYRGEKEELEIKRVFGKDLLMRTYYRLPFKGLKKLKTEDLGKFLEGAVMGAVRHVMSAKNYIDCREKQPEIAEKIKEYLLKTEGNPFFECGIPKECLAIEMTKVKFRDEMEKKFFEPEMKRKEAEGAKPEKERMITLAEGEKKRINLVTKAYINQGVPPEIAGMLGGVTGKAMTFEQLRDLAIFQGLGGFGKGKISEGDIIEGFKKLSPQERTELLKKISK